MNYTTRFRVLMFGTLLLMTNLVSALVSGVSETTEIFDVMACIICQIMQFFYYIVGIIATLMIIVAGIKWITSSDDPEARNSAKSQVFNVIIGLIIVLLAAFLVSFIVFNAFLGGEMIVLDPMRLVLNGCGTVCNPTNIAA